MIHKYEEGEYYQEYSGHPKPLMYKVLAVSRTNGYIASRVMVLNLEGGRSERKRVMPDFIYIPGVTRKMDHLIGLAYELEVDQDAERKASYGNLDSQANALDRDI